MSKFNVGDIVRIIADGKSEAIGMECYYKKGEVAMYKGPQKVEFADGRIACVYDGMYACEIEHIRDFDKLKVPKEKKNEGWGF